MNQLAFDLEQNELQNRYLQARELVIRFLNNDPNVTQDAFDWIQTTNVKHAENDRHAGFHIGDVKSSNISRISFYKHDEYQLVIEFRSGGKYAYALPLQTTYLLHDGTTETKTPLDIFYLLAEENDKKKNGDKEASVNGLFDALIKRADNKTEPIQYKRI